MERISRFLDHHEGAVLAVIAAFGAGGFLAEGGGWRRVTSEIVVWTLGSPILYWILGAVLGWILLPVLAVRALLRRILALRS